MHEAADSEIGLRVAAGNRSRVDTGRERTSFGACVKPPAKHPEALGTSASTKFLEFIIATRSFDSINSVPPRFEHVRLVDVAGEQLSNLR